eukprot:2443363-Lingulodinium_polyedra.AAC.1
MATETVALLQEARWSQTAAAIWSSGLCAHAGVVLSAARAGARGGLQGGGAILCNASSSLAA